MQLRHGIHIVLLRGRRFLRPRPRDLRREHAGELERRNWCGSPKCSAFMLRRASTLKCRYDRSMIGGHLWVGSCTAPTQVQDGAMSSAFVPGIRHAVQLVHEGHAFRPVEMLEDEQHTSSMLTPSNGHGRRRRSGTKSAPPSGQRPRPENPHDCADRSPDPASFDSPCEGQTGTAEMTTPAADRFATGVATRHYCCFRVRATRS